MAFVGPDEELGAGFSGRFEPLFEDDKPNPIEGTISAKLDFLHDPEGELEPNTILFFRVQIQDRDLNLSNEVATDTILIRETF
ncbi:MAG: hypothetical protein HC880_15040 [Bacteroidia bacterium]|nr:hypothetical protein [Bacteroidia bacterium]